MDRTSNDRSSFADSSSTVPPTSSASDGAHTDFAFLVHSQDTLGNTLPPNVDNKSLARQRRRRTSPEDQAILEEEYNRNEKPNKAARRAIVERVSGMGEKEVQIWFQNRRQNHRRRSRPLLPNEVSAQNTDQTSTPLPAQIDTYQDSKSADVAEAVAKLNCLKRPGQSTEDASLPADDSMAMVIPETGAVMDAMEAAEVGLVDTSDSSTSKEAVSKVTSTTDTEKSKPARSLKRTSSGVRLSLTSEGSARILQEDEASPSPPRPQSTVMMMPDSTPVDSYRDASFPQTSMPVKVPQLRRGPSGRSRDSRAWSFWCDSDSRNELALKAEQEGTGSAAAAISLMRSHSNSSRRTILGAIPSGDCDRRSPSRAAKRPRPALARASTSIARFHGGSERCDGSHSLEEAGGFRNMGGKTSKTALRGLMQSPSADSDKENADPDALSNIPAQNHVDRSLVLGRARSRLNATRPNLAKSKTVPNRRLSLSDQLGDDENAYPEIDDEVADFMGRGRAKPQADTASQPAGVEVASEEELNCVRGLLFLSQAGSS